MITVNCWEEYVAGMNKVKELSEVELEKLFDYNYDVLHEMMWEWIDGDVDSEVMDSETAKEFSRLKKDRYLLGVLRGEIEEDAE